MTEQPRGPVAAFETCPEAAVGRVPYVRAV